MKPQEDVIVDIPPNRMKFFGGPGKMLCPGPATVAAVLKKVPHRKLITTNLITKKLTTQFKVQGTCPVTTQKALKAIAHSPNILRPAYGRTQFSSSGTPPGSTPEHGYGTALHHRNRFCSKRAGMRDRWRHSAENSETAAYRSTAVAVHIELGAVRCFIAPGTVEVSV